MQTSFAFLSIYWRYIKETDLLERTFHIIFLFVQNSYPNDFRRCGKKHICKILALNWKLTFLKKIYIKEDKVANIYKFILMNNKLCFTFYCFIVVSFKPFKKFLAG